MTIDVTIRPEEVGDIDAIDGVVSAAFGSSVEAALVRSIRSSVGFRPELTLVAIHKRRIVGHVMVSDVPLRRGNSTPSSIPMLSPLAVLPDWQRRGIGGALVRATSSIASSLGEHGIGLQGSPAFYGRFGFVPSVDHGITMDLPEWAPKEAAQLLPMADFDGTRTGHVVLPPAFDEID